MAGEDGDDGVVRGDEALVCQTAASAATPEVLAPAAMEDEGVYEAQPRQLDL